MIAEPISVKKGSRQGLAGWLKAKLFGGTADRIFRGMATLTAGTGIARLVGLLALPMLTRIYDASDFGVLALYAAVIAICLPLMTASYPLAIPLPRRDSMAMNLVSLSGGIMVLTATTFALVLWAFGERIFQLAGLEALSPYWFMVPIGLVAACVYDLLSSWATRKRAYREIARTQIAQSMLGAAVKIVLGLALLKPLGLLIGQVVQAGGGSGRLCLVFASDFRKHIRRMRPASLLRTARRYRTFPIYRLPSQFIVGVNNQLPVILIGSWFGIAFAGQFGLAMIALKIPLLLLAVSLSRAFYAEIATMRDLQAIGEMTSQVVKRLVPLGVFIAGGAFFLAPPLAQPLFGPGWDDVGWMIQCFSVYAGLALVASAIMPLLDVLEEQRTYLFLYGYRPLLLVAIFAAAVGPFGADGFTTTLVLGGVMAAFELLSIVVVLRLLQVRMRP